MILLVGALVLLIVSIQGYYLNQRYAQLMEYRIWQCALSVARVLAANTLLVEAFDHPDPVVTIHHRGRSVDAYQPG